jgi:hypothetical protein
MSRLKTISSDLASSLNNANSVKRRAAELAACEFALGKAGVEHNLVEEAVEAIRAGEVLTPDRTVAIDALVAKFDDEYFNLQEAAGEGKATVEDYLRAFSKARAVSAVSFAGRGTPDGAAEAIYEAAAAVGDDTTELFSDLQSILR